MYAYAYVERLVEDVILYIFYYTNTVVCVGISLYKSNIIILYYLNGFVRFITYIAVKKKKLFFLIHTIFLVPIVIIVCGVILMSTYKNHH